MLTKKEILMTYLTDGPHPGGSPQPPTILEFSVDDDDIADEDADGDEEDDGVCPDCHDEFCQCPSPEMVQHGLEKIYRVDMALAYCDDPEIRGLLEQALPLLYRAQELNDARVAAQEKETP
jgi:hypothetical protein